MKLDIISNLDQDHANKKLETFYKDELIPAEKKTYLTNLKAGQGPYLGIEGHDNKPKFIMDAASQIATLGLGFSPSVFFGASHLLESWTNNKNGEEFKKVRSALTNFLHRKTSWNKTYLTLCNSGAEANEIALGYCYKNRKNQTANKVLAFEGSFHGRMMVTLAATWNKVKREPFEWPEAECAYSPFPESKDGTIIFPIETKWKELWNEAPNKNFEVPSAYTDSCDELIKEEVKCLLDVREKLLTKEIFAIIVEPMQCEGGDRYGTNRFHEALLLMAKSFGVQVVHDEVQTGFHLGTEFFWHRQLGMTDLEGQLLAPDFVVCAKKAQVGMVLSHEDFKPEEKGEEFQIASVMRGYLHAIALDQQQEVIRNIESVTRPRLEALVNKFSEHLNSPRLNGVAFAVNLNDKEKVMPFISKRFDHGLLYYPAGSHTLRFRLNTSYSEKDLDFLFKRLEEICNDLFLDKEVNLVDHVISADRRNSELYEWHEMLLEAKLDVLNGNLNNGEKIKEHLTEVFKKTTDSDFVIIDKSNFASYKDSIQKLQEKIYEPTRQTDIKKFEESAHSQKGIALGLLKDNELVAICFSSPLADNPLERGVRKDPHFNNENALYMLDTTVDDSLQGKGVGRQLKYALTILAKEKGIERIQGRNRDRLAGSMLNINLSLGSYEQFYMREDYPDFEEFRDVFYYTSCTKWDKPKLNLSNAVHSPHTDRSLNHDFIKEQLPYLTNKVCLSNFVSERFLTQLKTLINVLPKSLQHAYTTSGQSECVDKVAKTLWFNINGSKKNKMLTFKGHYFGSGSFLSRSLSFEDDKFFKVDHLDTPTTDNQKEVLKAVESHLKSGDYLAIWLEPLMQKTLDRTPKSFIKELKKVASKYNVKIVFNETASSMYRYTTTYFASEDSELTPDAGFCFLGGQAGVCFMNKEDFVEKPLMLISTWDGDEFSLANYNRVLTKIEANVEDYKDIQKQFEDKLKDLFSKYHVEEYSLENGCGYFIGDVPATLSSMFELRDGRYIVMASRDSMLEFIGK